MACACVRVRLCSSVKVRLYNRTPLRADFSLWANVATAVHEHYQSFFRLTSANVADQRQSAPISAFPSCQGSYYGVDYGQARPRGRAAGRDCRQRFRARRGLTPPIPPPGRPISRADVATCAWDEERRFFGGYDHKAAAGIVHVANSSHCPRQENSGRGATTPSAMRGTASDRTRRAGRLSPLHRADGRRVHRQPARFLLSRSRRDQGIPQLLVSDPDRCGTVQQANLAVALHLVGRGRRHPVSASPVPTPLVDAVISP